MYVDRTLTCMECGTVFTFSSGEQAFYVEKGLTHEPKRCPRCRAKRRAASSSRAQSSQTYPITCAACGEPATVPFQPRGDRPVFCQRCYKGGPIVDGAQTDPGAAA